MYLWKYLRESRNILILAAILLTIMTVLVVKGEITMADHNITHFNTEDFPQFGGFFVAALYAQSAVLAFVAWLLGGVGLGRNLGEECGSYLLTRPRSRRWFLWRDWAYGMAEIAVIVAATNLLLWQLAHYIMMQFHDPLHGRVVFHGDTSEYLLSTLMGLIFLCVLIFCGLVFSVTYFSTILVKNGRGVVLGAGLFAGYVVLGTVIKHYWPTAAQLPHLVPRLFPLEDKGMHGLSDSFGISIAVHALVVLLFPIVAQQILERSDI